MVKENSTRNNTQNKTTIKENMTHLPECANTATITQNDNNFTIIDYFLYVFEKKITMITGMETENEKWSEKREGKIITESIGLQIVFGVSMNKLCMAILWSQNCGDNNNRLIKNQLCRFKVVFFNESIPLRNQLGMKLKGISFTVFFMFYFVV